MKKITILLTSLLLIISMVGCSDDDNPTTSTPEVTSVWNEAGGYWSTIIDATSRENFNQFSFTTQDTVVTGTPKPSAANAGVWDIAFRLEAIKTNGGTSSDGDVETASLGVVEYEGVTIADTAGLSWVSDNIDFFIDSFYVYTGPPNHLLLANKFVYSMVDASGEHFVKFQIDTIMDAQSQTDMGTVVINYYYQDTANSRSLAGTPIEVAISVNDEHAYFDFSTGAEVSPGDPTNSLDWDIDINAYVIAQNSGPNGIGACAAFQAFTDINDPTDINEFVLQPTLADAPMFKDIPGNALTDWYTYNGDTHKLPSNSEVYLLKTGISVYKLRIESFYGNTGDKPQGNYHFIWTELE